MLHCIPLLVLVAQRADEGGDAGQADVVQRPERLHGRAANLGLLLPSQLSDHQGG